MQNILDSIYLKQNALCNCGPVAIMNIFCHAGYPVHLRGELYKHVCKSLKFNPKTGCPAGGLHPTLCELGFKVKCIFNPSIERLEDELYQGNIIVLSYPIYPKSLTWHISLLIDQTLNSFLTVNDGIRRGQNIQYISKNYYRKRFVPEFRGPYSVRALIITGKKYVK